MDPFYVFMIVASLICPFLVVAFACNPWATARRPSEQGLLPPDPEDGHVNIRYVTI